jgi:triphosphoribosyl-dephospho-CoA synthase
MSIRLATRRKIFRAPHRRDSSLYRLVAATAFRALLQELVTWPKPGLVSLIDNGSHEDMDAAMLRRSAEALSPFFAELAQAGSAHAGMSCLRAIGLRAEAAMLAATGGVNTHRGSIFGLGLLCAAAGTMANQPDDADVPAPRKLGSIVARNWGKDILRGPIALHSHGTEVLRRYGAHGARGEAAAGFPSIYNIGLPALRLGRAIAPEDSTAGPVQVCFALIAAVRDTNLLHRGGAEGALYAREAAAAFLSDGGVDAPDWRRRAAAVHAGFVARRLSPGGCADLLAMTLFVDAVESGTSLLWRQSCWIRSYRSSR